MENSMQSNKIPLLMGRADTHGDDDHIVDITSSSDSSSSSSSYDRLSTFLEQQQIEDQTYTGSRVPIYQPQFFSAGFSNSNPRNSSPVRRGNNRGRQRSFLNSALWISFQIMLGITQIVAAVAVLSLSVNEKPQAPLKVWIVGYACGCLACLPLLYWRFKNRNQISEEDLSHTNMSAVSLTGRFVDDEGRWVSSVAARSSQIDGLPNSRIKAFFENFKMALDCFFAVWFVVGNVWIFGGHSSSSGAPNVYRLCVVFLTMSCVGYAMPFILCATVCCCLPCIISVAGLREEFSQTRGATQNLINTLPAYKFKLKKNKKSNVMEKSSIAAEGGIVAAGTDREREISGEDAVCCICLVKYGNNDDLRELPCSHFFHKECVDKWLKMNAICPLCKTELGDTMFSSLAEATANLRHTVLL